MGIGRHGHSYLVEVCREEKALRTVPVGPPEVTAVVKLAEHGAASRRLLVCGDDVVTAELAVSYGHLLAGVPLGEAPGHPWGQGSHLEARWRRRKANIVTARKPP